MDESINSTAEQLIEEFSSLETIQLQSTDMELESRLLIKDFYNTVKSEEAQLLERNSHLRFVG
ncbi:MAG: hypothetical protein COA73_10795 [Candidatus Hydrogenedentota bacterium]|nr:MAG: hypothetical protein COA73_10795 [Candidatus Hydrogenedentota bacterium]